MSRLTIEEAKGLLGKKPSLRELGDYLGKAESTVKKYPKDKKDLMVLGLWLKKNIKK